MCTGLIAWLDKIGVCAHAPHGSACQWQELGGCTLFGQRLGFTDEKRCKTMATRPRRHKEGGQIAGKGLRLVIARVCGSTSLALYSSRARELLDASR